VLGWETGTGREASTRELPGCLGKAVDAVALVVPGRAPEVGGAASGARGTVIGGPARGPTVTVTHRPREHTERNRVIVP